MASSHYRDNFSRWQKIVTTNIKKHLMEEAEQLQVDIAQVAADKLKEVHKANVIASYYPRSKNEQDKVEYNKIKKAEEKEDLEKYGIKSRRSRKTLSYRHTGTLEEAIDTKIEKKDKYWTKVSVIIKPIPYPEDHPRKDGPVTAVQVYEWLREGTRGGGHDWFYNEEAERPTAYNYPTPAHLFEMHTALQIKGFINNLDIKKYAKMTQYKIKGGKK